MEKYVPTGSEFKPLDFGRKAQYFTLDVITTVASSKAVGYLATDSDVFGFIKTVEETFLAAIMVTVLPWINSVLQTKLVKKLLPSEKGPLGFGKLVG